MPRQTLLCRIGRPRGHRAGLAPLVEGAGRFWRYPREVARDLTPTDAPHEPAFAALRMAICRASFAAGALPHSRNTWPRSDPKRIALTPLRKLCRWVLCWSDIGTAQIQLWQWQVRSAPNVRPGPAAQPLTRGLCRLSQADSGRGTGRAADSFHLKPLTAFGALASFAWACFIVPFRRGIGVPEPTGAVYSAPCAALAFLWRAVDRRLGAGTGAEWRGCGAGRAWARGYVIKAAALIARCRRHRARALWSRRLPGQPSHSARVLALAVGVFRRWPLPAVLAGGQRCGGCGKLPSAAPAQRGRMGHGPLRAIALEVYWARGGLVLGLPLRFWLVHGVLGIVLRVFPFYWQRRYWGGGLLGPRRFLALCLQGQAACAALRGGAAIGFLGWDSRRNLRRFLAAFGALIWR